MNFVTLVAAGFMASESVDFAGPDAVDSADGHFDFVVDGAAAAVASDTADVKVIGVEGSEDVEGFRVVLVVGLQCERDDEVLLLLLLLLSAGGRCLLLLLVLEADLLLG